MKESIGSLKTYFIVIGIFSLLGWIISLFFDITYLLSSHLTLPNTIFILLMTVPSLFLSACLLYLGLRLKTLIVTSPNKIVLFLQISCFALPVLSFVISYFNDRSLNITSLGLSLLIGWYLIKNVKRLSLQSVPTAMPPVTPMPPVQ